jgi:predicted TIM-barrel fold metal-dependent hydrolase
MRIDTHVHVWSLDATRYPWHPTLAHVPIPTRPATVEQFLAAMDEGGVEQAVLIQPSTYGWDDSYLVDALRSAPARFAGVCLVDPRADAAGDDLRHWCREAGCCGLRINVIGEPGEPDWLLERGGLWDAAEELDATISFQARPDQVGVVGRLADRRPASTFVVDYIGEAGYHDPRSAERLASIADRPNVFFKLIAAGQDSAEDYPFPDLWPHYERLVRLVTVDRIVFGTDHPLVLERTDYRRAASWPEVLPFLDDAARARIDANASRVWRLPPAVDQGAS